MSLLDTVKKQILENCLDLIAGIASKEYQKRVWIRGEGPEVDDFDETVCNFLPEARAIIECYKDFEFTDHQYHLFSKFCVEFEAFCRGPALEYYAPEVFIDTPEWEKIIAGAKEVLQAFNYKEYED